MYTLEASSKMTAYVWDAAETPPQLVGIFTEFDAKKVVELLNAERNRHPHEPKPRKVVHRDKEI